MKEKNFDYVYLATEDKRILAEFQAAFREKLILPDNNYFDYDYEKSGLRDFVASILDDMTKENDDHTYEFNGVNIYLDR